MGSAMVIPEEDEKLARAKKTFRLTPTEISELFMVFLKLDKQKQGLVNLSDLFAACELKRNDFTDSICDAFDIIVDKDGYINFSDFLTLVLSYCMFEPPEILRLIFYTYDMDKEGFIDAEELKRAMNMLHEVEAPNTVVGSVKKAWVAMEFAQDGKIDFREFEEMSKRFPAILDPAFKTQNFMMMGILGELWWATKKRNVQEEKDAADFLWKKQQEAIKAKMKLKETRHIRKKMGLLKFYCCPCLRYMYDDTRDKLTEEERDERERLLALARRQADLDAKNPNTVAYKNFQRKIKKEETLVKQRIITAERTREDRKDNRLERRIHRRMDKELTNSHITARGQ